MRRRRDGLAIRLRWSVGVVVMAACHDTGTGSPPTVASSPAVGTIPAGGASVEIALNGRATGTVEAVCLHGLFLSTAVRNLSLQPFTVSRLTVDFEPLSSSCQRHEAPVDPVLSVVVAPGVTEQLRVFNAAGTLCEPPYGQPGCRWRATAVVTTNGGAGVGTLDFVGQAPRTTVGDCSRVVPEVRTPRTGETVSGVVRVEASLAEGGGCNISARTVVLAYSDRGVIVGQSGMLDLGDPWLWDTTRLSNGRYRLRAEQNCCRILGDPVEITVRN